MNLRRLLIPVVAVWCCFSTSSSFAKKALVASPYNDSCTVWTRRDSVGYKISTPDIWLKGYWLDSSGQKYVTLSGDTNYLWYPPGGADVPPGIRIPVFIEMRRSRQDIHPHPDFTQAFQINFEYDSSVLTLDHIDGGEWRTGGEYCVSGYTVLTERPPTWPTYCNLSEELPRHTQRIALVASACIGGGIYPDDGPVAVAQFYFTFNSGGPRTLSWPFWDQSLLFSASCLLAVPPVQGVVLVSVDTDWDANGRPSHACDIENGDPGFRMHQGCITLDLFHEGYEDEAGSWCPEAQLGRTCLNCPGCNYWTECYDDPTPEECRRNPYAENCNQFGESPFTGGTIIWR